MLFLLTTNGLTKHLGTSSSQPLKNPAQTHGQSSFCMLTADHFSWIDASGSPLRESENESVANVSWTNPEKKRQKTPQITTICLIDWEINSAWNKFGFSHHVSWKTTLLEATGFDWKLREFYVTSSSSKKNHQTQKTLNHLIKQHPIKIRNWNTMIYIYIYQLYIYIYESYGKLQHTSETNT